MVEYGLFSAIFGVIHLVLLSWFSFDKEWIFLGWLWAFIAGMDFLTFVLPQLG